MLFPVREPIDVIPSKNNGPYAIKTRLGWYIIGPVNGTRSKQGIHCKDVVKHYCQTKNSVEENDVRDMLTKLYNLEFIEAGANEKKLEASMSREDKKIHEDSTRRYKAEKW